MSIPHQGQVQYTQTPHMTIAHVTRVDLSNVAVSTPIQTFDYDVASIQWRSMGGSAWATGVVTLKATNSPGAEAVDTHPTGYAFGGVATTSGITDAFPLDHGWLVLEVTTAQSGVSAEFWICMRKRR